MKLLLDQNLSRRLLPDMEPVFPGSAHVQTLALDRETDRTIWEFARREGFAVVTKDADFLEMSLLLGYPPKVIWLNLGNVSNAVVRNKILGHLDVIGAFLRDEASGVLEIE
jgi:predicted nuclease of predicted toxin-antitoxin system